MATLAQLQTKLSEVETALSDAVTRGLSRITVGSVDKTFYSIAELRAWRNELQEEISSKSASGGMFNYSTHRRVV